MRQGVHIDPGRDRITVNGKVVQAATRHVYILLNKPAGYVSTVHDPQGRPTVLDLLPRELRDLRVYPVGRLDADTSGLLLLTNDGEFALRLSHPRYAREKQYEALVEGHPTQEVLMLLHRGVTIMEDDGRKYLTSPAQVRLLRRVGNEHWLALTIHEGRKRQVRRMLAAVGHPVRHLMRVRVAHFTLQGVPVGRWRYLTEQELLSLAND
jgi:pseudouridine synthase